MQRLVNVFRRVPIVITWTLSFRRRHAALCAAALLTAPALAQSRDPAELVPSDALACVTWSQLVRSDTTADRMVASLASAVTGSADMSESDAAMLRDVLAIGLATARGAGAIALYDVILEQGKDPDIQAAAFVDAGADTGMLNERLRAFSESNPRRSDVTIDGVALTRLELPDGPGAIYFGLHEQRFVAAFGEAALRKMLAGFKGDGLARSEDYRFVREKVRSSENPARLSVYVDLARGWKRFYDTMTALEGPPPPQAEVVFNEIGVKSLRALYLHCDGAADGHTACFIRTSGPLKGALKLWDQQPLTDADIRIVPRNAYWAQVSNLDLYAAWKETLRVIEAVDADAASQVESAPAALGAILGFSLTDDLLPTIGDTWALFDAPAHGGLVLTGATFVLELRKPADFTAILSRAVSMADNAMAMARNEDDEVPDLQVKTARFGDHEITYLLFAGYPVPVAPAWGVHGDRWVFGLYPQTVAAALQHVAAGSGATLLDHPDFQAARARLPEKITGLGYVDARGMAASLGYPLTVLAATAATSMAAGADSQANLNWLPLLDEYLRSVRNSVSTSSTDADGLLYMHVGSASPLFALAAGAMLTGVVAAPAVYEAREQAERVRSASNLRQLLQAAIIHAAEKNKYPQSWDDVLPYLGGGPRAREILTAPGDPPGFVSYTLVAGHTDRSNSQHVLAYETIFGDSATVGFVDGSVRRLPRAEFIAVLRETYKALGREADLPPQFRE